MTDELTKTEWLNSLKAGDEVIIDGSRGFDLCVVARRTKTGRIVVTVGRGEREFNPDGSGRGGAAYHYSSLKLPTQAHRDRIERANLAHELSQVDYRKLTLAQLRAIVALLPHPAPPAALDKEE